MTGSLGQLAMQEVYSIIDIPSIGFFLHRRFQSTVYSSIDKGCLFKYRQEWRVARVLAVQQPYNLPEGSALTRMRLYPLPPLRSLVDYPSGVSRQNPAHVLGSGFRPSPESSYNALED